MPTTPPSLLLAMPEGTARRPGRGIELSSLRRLLAVRMKHHYKTPMHPLRTLALFVVTGVAEIVGCYLPFLWLRKGRSVWLLGPAALSLALFAWLLTLHPTGAGRTYAAYGGVYVTAAIVWMWAVEKQTPDRWDLIGAGVAVVGMMIIAFAPR